MALRSLWVVPFKVPFGAVLAGGAILPWLVIGQPGGAATAVQVPAGERSPSPGVEFGRLNGGPPGPAGAGAVGPVAVPAPAGFENDSLVAQPPVAPGAFVQVAPPLGGGLVTDIE